MSYFTAVDKSVISRLFNRGGYVLDFSTYKFDQFTLQSVGIAVCERYGLSKGQSLEAFINENPENKGFKLVKDLLDYYETVYSSELRDNNDFAALYAKCRASISRLGNTQNPFAGSACVLKEKFSSNYLADQIDLMMNLQEQNPTEAIGKAKELIESCCKTILEERNIAYEKSWDVGKLAAQTFSILKIAPQDIPETAPEVATIKSILQSLKTIANNIAELRNPYGSGHGKSASYKGLEERHAKLAVGSSITLVNFLWDSHERQQKQ